MKNLILLFLLLAGFTAVAQVESAYKPLLSVTNGTALDTATTVAKSQVLRVPGVNNVITIVATVTEISGTTAGTVKLYGSLNGTNYAEIDATKVFSPADIAGAQMYAWHVNPSQFTYYKTTYTPTGTMSAKVTVGLLRR